MKKIYLTILLIVLAVSFAYAQQPLIAVKGHVTDKQTGAPIAGQTMFVMLDSLNSVYYNQTVTNENGYYSFILPFNAFAMQGSFTVYTNDCNGSIIYGTGAVIPGNESITIDFSICSNSHTGCEAFFKYLPSPDNMLHVAFYDGSQYLPASGNIKFIWNFGDSTSASEQNPVHTYIKPGIYNVCLSISSSDTLCSSSICLPVTVGFPTPGSCENSFWYYNDSAGNQYTFNGAMLNGLADTWKWDFGDGTTATGQTVTHSFAADNNTFKVCLTTTGTGTGETVCVVSSCQEIVVNNLSPCESAFSYFPDSTVSGYTFEGSAKNSQITSWTWDFGDGTTATGQKVSHSFTNTEVTHTVCLTTTGVNSDGSTCTHSFCKEINVFLPYLCESSFAYYSDSTASGYNFEGFTKNNQVNSWIWDFGDGTTATGQRVLHSFKADSNTISVYYVCLTTTGTGADGISCTHTSCQEIYTSVHSPCENYFSAYSADGSIYSFSGNVVSDAQADYFWDFGDGTTGTGKVVTHAFGKIYPVFNVCLTTIVAVPESSGFYMCKSISCQSIFSGADSSICKAVFSAIPDSAKNTFRFENLAQKKYNYTLWDFGDGNQSTELNDVHTYLSPGIYMACLTVSDSIANCSDQSCQEIWVDITEPSCQASFSVVQSDSSNSTTSGYMFFNTSAPGYTNQKWSFGDGTGSIEPNPVHTYAFAGIFTACVTIWDTLGKCQDSYCMDIYAGKATDDNTVSGIVTAGNKIADHGIVWLVSPNNTYTDEKQLDSTGIYHFTGVPYGKYYIYAMLTPGAKDFFAYIPTYYSSSLSWQGATLITTGEPNAWYQLSLVPSMNFIPGDATITGNINWARMTEKDENDPVSNVEVVLYNNTGDPIAYTFTDSNGTYIFEHLPYGNYILVAEMTGMATESIVVNLTKNSATATINFVINEAAINILGITDHISSKLTAGDPFPNPAGEILNIKLNASVSQVAIIDIIDMQGHIVRSESITLSEGSNPVSIATSDLSRGIYMLRIKSDGYKPVLRKFIK